MKNRTDIQRQNNSSLNNILNNILNKVFNNISMTKDNLAIVGTFFLRVSVNNTVHMIPMLIIVSI